MEQLIRSNPSLRRIATLGFYRPSQSCRLLSAKVRDTTVETGQNRIFEIIENVNLRDDPSLFHALTTLCLVEHGERLGIDPTSAPDWYPTADEALGANVLITQPDLLSALESVADDELAAFLIDEAPTFIADDDSSARIFLPRLLSSIGLALQRCKRGAELDSGLRYDRDNVGMGLAKQLAAHMPSSTDAIVELFFSGSAPATGWEQLTLNAGFLAGAVDGNQLPPMRSLEVTVSLVWAISQVIAATDRPQGRVFLWLSASSLDVKSEIFYVDLVLRGDITNVEIEFDATLTPKDVEPMRDALEILEGMWFPAQISAPPIGGGRVQASSGHQIDHQNSPHRSAKRDALATAAGARLT